MPQAIRYKLFKISPQLGFKTNPVAVFLPIVTLNTSVAGFI